MIEAIANQLKALAHPQRLKLLQLIRSQRFCCYVAQGGKEAAQPIGACVGDLARECELAPSTVSHHLKELRVAGLITVERRGQFLYCRACEDVLARLSAFLRMAPLGPELVPPSLFAEKKP